jgi:hypothetical protein
MMRNDRNGHLCLGWKNDVDEQPTIAGGDSDRVRNVRDLKPKHNVSGFYGAMSDAHQFGSMRLLLTAGDGLTVRRR